MKIQFSQEQHSARGRFASGLLQPSLVFVPLLLWWAYYVWRHYLPRGPGKVAPILKALFNIPLPAHLKPWAIDFVLALALAFVALCVGGWLLERARLQTSVAEHLLLATSTGFMVLILIAAALSLIRLFKVWPLRILVVAFFVLAVFRAAREARTLRELMRRAWCAAVVEPVSFIYIVLTAIFLFFGFTAAAAPETSFDALNVHLYYPRLFMERGYFYLTDVYRTTNPLYAQVLYSLGLAVHGPGLARFLNFLFLPGLAIAVFLLVRAIAEERPKAFSAGLLGILFLVSCPIVLYQATTCYPDGAMAFFSTVALYAAIRWLQTEGRGWLWVAGIFAGMSAGTKYAGLYFATIVALILGGHALYRRGLWSALRGLLVFGLLTVVIGGPWYLRNWYYTGDPVHPALHKFIKKPVLAPDEAEELMRDAMNPNRFPMTAKNLLTLPWLLTMKGSQLQGTVGPVFLVVLPLVLLSLTLNAGWLAVAFAALVFPLFWFSGPQWLRYFLPGIPLLSSLGAYGVYHARTPASLRFLWAVLAVAFALVNLPGLNDRWVSGGEHVLSAIPYHVVFGDETPAEYQRERVVGYDAAQYVNTLALPADTRILPVGVGFLPYFSRYPVIDIVENREIVCYDEKHRFVGCFLLNSDTLRRNMDRHHVGLLSIRRGASWIKMVKALRLEDPFLRTDFKFLHYVGGCFLYEHWPSGPASGMRYVNVDLLYRFATRDEVRGSDPFDIRLANIQPARQDERLALVILPANELSYYVRLGENPQLSFTLGMSPDAASRATGTDLTIYIRPKGGEPRLVFTKRYLPAEAAKGWLAFSVNLAAYSGRECFLTLRTTPLSPGGQDWLAIADPVIYATESGIPPAPSAGLYRMDPASEKNPIHIRFTPDKVRSGVDEYTIEIPRMANQTVDLLFTYGAALPAVAERFCRLDASGRAKIFVHAGIPPGIVRVIAVRRTGQELWQAAEGTIEVIR